MTIVVGETGSFSWSQTAGEICRDALEHLNAVGAGETVSAADQAIALRALDAVLKELPLSGYSWPKLSGEVALSWSAGTPQTVSLPADYFSYPSVWKTADGKRIPLTQIPHAVWIKMPNRADTAAQPTHFYVDPTNTLYFWPAPSADPVSYLQYQRVVDDAEATSAPDLPQYWIGALGLMVADEISMKFGLSAPDRLEIHQRAEAKKQKALENSIPFESISFSADDCSAPYARTSPLSWR